MKCAPAELYGNHRRARFPGWPGGNGAPKLNFTNAAASDGNASLRFGLAVSVSL